MRELSALGTPRRSSAQVTHTRPLAALPRALHCAYAFHASTRTYTATLHLERVLCAAPVRQLVSCNRLIYTSSYTTYIRFQYWVILKHSTFNYNNTCGVARYHKSHQQVVCQHVCCFSCGETVVLVEYSVVPHTPPATYDSYWPPRVEAPPVTDRRHCVHSTHWLGV